MTVGELIAALQKCDQDKQVVAIVDQDEWYVWANVTMVDTWERKGWPGGASLLEVVTIVAEGQR